jgi:hypothetical protein
MYQDSLAVLIGSSGRDLEMQTISDTLHARGFRVEKLADPTLKSLSDRISSLRTDFSDSIPPAERRVVIYITGETLDAEARNEVFLRVADTPDDATTAAELRSVAFPLDDLRYLAKGLDGTPLLVVINSGFRALFLEESGEQPAFLTPDSFNHPAPAFIVSGSQSGLPSDEFPALFVNAFEGAADTDADRQVSVVELARYLPAPAYLARIIGVGNQSGPGLVFDLPADAIVNPPSGGESSARPTPLAAQDAVSAGPAPSPVQAATPTTAVEALNGEPMTKAAPSIAELTNTEKPSPGMDFAIAPGIALHWLPAGEFTLNRSTDGSASPGVPSATDSPIRISGFWIGISEITTAQYLAVTKRDFGGEPGKPLGNVTWEEADSFCKTLTENERAIGRLPEGYLYRLPYEIEWEYASMPGPVRFRRSNLLPVASWASQLAASPPGNGASPPPGAPSAVMAMTSGLKEWCQDDFIPDPGETRIPPPPPTAKVVRGGLLDADMIRLSTRFGIYGPTDRLPHLGFRIVLAPEVIELPTTTAPPAPLDESKPFTLDELFEPSPYAEWDQYNKSQILKKAQTAFKSLDLYTSTIDGDAGPSTQKALNQYQANQRLPVTGRLDQATLTALQLTQETKKAAPPQGPWWVTRPNSPRSGDAEPPLSAYHGLKGRLKLLKDKEKNTLDQKEYRKFLNYAKWEEVQ